MSGPAPKLAATRQRRNKTTTRAQLEAPAATKVDLPEREAGWHELTGMWWATIWDSPMAEEWVDADVPGLLALAFLVDAFWRTGEPKLHAEIRQAGREYGLSPLSRRTLQWEVIRVKRAERSQPTAPVVRPKDPRLRLVSSA